MNPLTSCPCIKWKTDTVSDIGKHLAKDIDISQVGGEQNRAKSAQKYTTDVFTRD